MDALPIRAGIEIPASELSFRAVRASGPGGQNVNKVSSKVELIFDVRNSSALDSWTKSRVLSLGARFADKTGVITISSQLTRDQHRNLEDARAKLVTLVLQALERPKPRRATKPTRGSKERRLSDKRHASERKSARSHDE